MEEKEKRAGVARAAIDAQHGPREHVHRDIASEAPKRDPKELRAALADEHKEAKESYLEAMRKYEDAKRDLDTARQTSAATGKFIGQPLWQKLNNDVSFWKIEVQNRQGKAASIREYMRRSERTLPEYFIEFARVMLPTDMYLAIHDQAVLKSREEKARRRETMK